MQTIRLNVIKSITLFFILTASFTTNAQTKVIDGIVAQLGDEIVLLSDIENRRLEMIQEGYNLADISDCYLLEEMLFEKLLITQAQIDSIEISDDYVNAEMENRLRYIAQQIGSIEELEKFYGKSVAQIKAEFFNIIKKRMMAERMREMITENVVITPSEVKAFYNKIPKDSLPYINQKVSIGQIVFYPQVTPADKEKRKKELEARRMQIEKGERTFESVALLESEDPGSRISGGDLGWNSRGTMVPEFEAAVFSLEKNGISPVFETNYGFHIVQLLDRKGDNYHCRHILFVPRFNDNALIKSASTADSLYKAIKKGTISFEEAAMRFSQDEYSKQNGGKIVNPYTGDYYWDLQNIGDIDPQMSSLIPSMRVGDMTQPALYDNMMEQKKGVRIVKLLERTKPHIANLQDDYQLIQMAALNEKRQKAIDDWVTTKIEGVFIRIFDPKLLSCKFKYPWLKSNAN